MKFCPDCGNNIEGMKFCTECGYKVNSDVAVKIQEPTQEVVTNNSEQELLKFSTYMFGLENKKAKVGGKFDLSVPQFNYTVTTERLIIEKQGVVSKNRDDVELYKIKDINVKQGLKEKMMKVGDIEIISIDKSDPVVTLKRIHNPLDVKETLRSAVRDSKKDMKVSYREDL